MLKRIAPLVEPNTGHQDEENGLSASERNALDRHADVIERAVKRTFVEVGLALRAIRDGRLYREQDSTFGAYLRRRWGFTRQRAHQLIAAAGSVVSTAVDSVDSPEMNEWQMRALKGLSPEEVHRVCETARTMVAAGRRITATDLHRARALLLAPAPRAVSTPQSASERLTASLDKTVYEEQFITLVRADARTVVPPLARDAVIITDPPYNIGFDFDGEYDDSLPAEEYDELLRAILRPPCVVLHRPEGICRLSRLFGMDPTAIVAWVHGDVDTTPWRAIGWFGLKPDLGGVGDWWNIQPLTGKCAEKTAHPCQTPQALMDQVIAVTPDLEFIVDPFAGSGTTLVVAKSRKLRALGIEQSARFCDIAVQRLRDGE